MTTRSIFSIIIIAVISVFANASNKNSKINARRYYIPVETKDGKFDVTIHLTAVSLDDPTFKLTDSYKRTIIIKGSMYEDDFTGDR